MVIVVETFDSRVLDSAVHPLDLTVGPWVAGFGKSMLDIKISAGHLERMAAKGHVVPAHYFNVFRCPAIASWVGEVGAVIGQHGMDFVWHSHSQIAQEVPGNAPGCLLNQLDKGKFGRPINGYEKIKLAFGRMYLGNVNMEVSDWIAFELFLRLFVAFDIGQARNAVALKASVQ